MHGIKKSNIKQLLTLALTLSLTIAALTSCSSAKKSNEPPRNPLTNEKKFNADAVGARPVAVVVENTPDARPQWGIDDKKYSPDILLQGEVEGGITRTLWFYADSSALPKKVGPMRSARPPYIRFSQLFDAIFVHWGQSSSGEGYTGAKEVFEKHDIDHINAMSYSPNNDIFVRITDRDVNIEHTGAMISKKLPGEIKKHGFRKELKQESFTDLKFNKKAAKVSNTDCGGLSLKYSSRTETSDWTYNKKDKKYHTSNFDTDVARTNLLVLFDKTEYQTKLGYNGTYCDYKLSGGEGKLASNGSVLDIKWKVKDGKLRLLKYDKKKKKNIDVKLNTGKTWIGWASSNNGGSVDISALKTDN